MQFIRTILYNYIICNSYTAFRELLFITLFKFLRKYIYNSMVFFNYSDVPTPPLEKYYFASVRGLASNRSERLCLAARTLLLADFAMLSSAVS
jgi:hypothetical protein